MNTQSKIKVLKSGDYSYLYIYFKSGKDLLRMNTKYLFIKGKMTKDMLFSSKVDDYESKNKEILELKAAVDSYVFVKQKEVLPAYSQKELKHFLKYDYNKRGDLYSGKPYVPSKTIVDENKSLIEYFDDYIQFRRNKGTLRNTLKEFTTVKNRITEFDRYKKSVTKFSDINLTWSDNLEDFLRNKVKIGKKSIGYKAGTIEKTYSVLITVLYHYFERKDELNIQLPDKFRSKGFKRGEKSRNAANPLTFDQFETLINHEFKEKHFNETRDRFCLQCCTGLRFGDLFIITEDSINNNRIVLIPKKTARYNKKVYIPINTYSRQILEKYKYNTKVLTLGNQPYNRNLKAMFKEMIKEYPEMKYRADYGTHNGRDTFISICVEKGVDFKTILEWVGQSSYSIMDRYIQTTDEHKKQQMGNTFGS